MIRRFPWFFLLLAAWLGAVDELALITTVNTERLGLEDRLQLTVTFRGIGNPPPPDLSVIRDFDVVPGITQQGTEFVMNQGGSTILTRFVFQLRPKRIGKLTVPALRALINGRSLESKPLRVEVVAGHQAPQPRQPAIRRMPGFSDDPLESLFDAPTRARNPDLFVRARPAQTRLYEGEALLVMIELLTRDPMLEGRRLQADSVPGFWTEWLQPQNGEKEREEVIDGKAYAVIEIDRGLFIPQQPGPVVIPAFEYGFIINSGSAARSLFSLHQQVVRRSAAVNLEVLPLPTEAKGLPVGRFVLSAEAQPRTLDITELLTLSLVISGSGNVRSLIPPPLPVMDGIKPFPAKIDRRSRVVDGRLETELTAEIPVSLTRAGSMVIPALTFRFFNPESGRIEETASLPLTLEVTGKDEFLTGNLEREPASVSRTGEDIEYLLEGSFIDPHRSWVYGPLFSLFLGLPFLLPLSLLGYRHIFRPLQIRLTRGGRFARLQVLQKNLTGVSRAEDLVGPLDAFLMELLALSPSQMDRPRIEEGLRGMGLPDASLQRLMEIRESLQGLRFAGGHWSEAESRVLRQELTGFLDGLVRGRS